MTIRRTALAGLVALSLSTSGCSSIYEFDGKIAEEQVRFHRGLTNHNILEVKRVEGELVKYVDGEPHDLILDYISITKNGKTATYKRDGIGEVVLNEAQSQFDGYLAKILELKRARGLADIKKE